MKKRQLYLLLLLPMLSFSFNVGDKVWNDVNYDWKQNVGELGYANVTVELYDDNQKKVQTTKTDKSGKYNFKNVKVGEYIVRVVPFNGLSVVTLNNIELWVEKDRNDIDFGVNKKQAPGKDKYTVGNMVWLDSNKDWEHNKGESGIPNVKVELYNDKGVLLQTVSTNRKGEYAFENVELGEYTVKVLASQGMKSSTLSEIELWVESNRTEIGFGLFKEDKNEARGVVINEILAANANTNLDPDYKQFSDWIELYNTENHSVDIGGYYLSDKKKDLEKWYVPRGTKIAAHSYLLVWADDEDDKKKALHTNFKLSQKGEEVFFSNDEGVLIDSLKFSKQEADVSCAKVDNTVVYMSPTPNAKNSKSVTTSAKSKKPKFSLESGFYDETQRLELTQKNDAIIYYTTDGSIPTKLSKKYSKAIVINKTMVVRIRAEEKEKFLSSINNQSYFINEKITLPVVSIGINQEYLTDQKIGIYTNYNEEWMRGASVEYFKDGKSFFSENVGIRIFGGHTRTFNQKSLAIFTKAKYGEKSIKYALFADKPEIKKVKSFVLRNSGNDWGYTMMKDALVHRIVKGQMDLDYQSYEPSVVFINGKYWGIHNIREKTNEDYVEANHGVDADEIDLLEGKYEVKEGSNKDYKALINYIESNGLVSKVHYDYVATKMDIDEYINYMIIEIYAGNLDWPYTNIKYWKEQGDKGKWRWILYDTDRGFEDADRDSFDLILDANGEEEPNPPWSTFLFRSLMENNAFKEKFLSSFKTHLDTTFTPKRIEQIIVDMKNKLKPEIKRHFRKWPRKNISNWETGNSDSIVELRQFSSERRAVIKRLMLNYFNAN